MRGSVRLRAGVKVGVRGRVRPRALRTILACTSMALSCCIPWNLERCSPHNVAVAEVHVTVACGKQYLVVKVACRGSFLTTILTTCYLLHACYTLLASCYLLHACRGKLHMSDSSLPTCYLLLATCCLLLATCYVLLATCYTPVVAGYT